MIYKQKKKKKVIYKIRNGKRFIKFLKIRRDIIILFSPIAFFE